MNTQPNPTQPVGDQIEWHTEAATGQCHAWLAVVLAVDSPVYTALCTSSAPKVYVLDTCAPPVCARCASIVTAAGGQVPQFKRS